MFIGEEYTRLVIGRFGAVHEYSASNYGGFDSQSAASV